METVLPRRRKSQGSIRSPVVKRDSQSQVVLEGWLYKLEGGALRQWKNRWCVLADFCLFFYKGRDEDKVFSSVLLPSYKISLCSSEDKISRKFAFKAEHQNMKTYYFAADSKETMNKWMSAMSLACVMQKFGRGDTFESSPLSSANDDEDSGFTSYQSRRYGGQGPNSTLDGSFASEPLNQRCSSYGDRVGEMLLGSDDKYPNVYESNQSHLYKALSVDNDVPHRQPLYANAPPKPRRLTQSDVYAIAPSEQYGSMGYDNLAPDLSNSHYPGSLDYQSQYPKTHHANANIPQEVLDTCYNMHSPHSGDVEHSYEPQNVSKVVEQPPRPHSADFLERDAECLSVTHRNAGGKIQPQRPKSSLECYDRFWETEECGFEDYREAVRSQADSLYMNRKIQHSELRSDRGPKEIPSSTVQRKNVYNNSSTVLTETKDPHLGPLDYNENECKSESRHMFDKHYSSKPESHLSPEKKSKTHEESMKRLIEWKQRMLQSPLTKRSQHQSSAQNAGSPGKPPSRPPLPSEYRQQVLQELESHEARLRLHEHEVSHGRSKSWHDPSNRSVFPNTFHEQETCDSKGNSSFDLGTYDTPDSCPTVGKIQPECEDVSGMYKIGDDSWSKAENEKVMYCVDSDNNEILISYKAEDSPVASSVPFIVENSYLSKEHELNRSASSNEVSSVSSYRHQVNQPLTKYGVERDLSETVSASHQRSESAAKFPSAGAGSHLPHHYNTSYSSDDEASGDSEHRCKRSNLRTKSSLHRTSNNVSDSEIHVKEPNQLRKLVQHSEGLTSKGKRLSISAGDLLGKTHEELVLLLIQLRRNQSRISRAKEKCQRQLENEQQLQKTDQGCSPNASELVKQITQLEKQYEVTRPLVNLVDNMVKLGSLYGSSDNGNSFPQIDDPVAEAFPVPHTQGGEKLPEASWAGFSQDESDLRGHLNEIYNLDKGLRQESHSFSSLQQDKEMLEFTLNGMKSKILDHQDKPIELQRLRKQQKMIEKELSRVKRLLSHSAKKIEEATTKNDQLEQEILCLRQKIQQALNTGSCEMETCLQSRADLEAELTRVQNVLEELANHRQEINNTVEKLRSEAHLKVSLHSTEVRASPTGVAGSAPLPLRKKQQSSYLETDLDTMVTRDLSTVVPCLDDIPVYVNAEEISANQGKAAAETDCPPEYPPPPLPQNADSVDSSQCSLQDINDADDRMKRFYGILPREKSSEIKTVRIVKRQSERRNRERDKKRVTYDEQSLVWVSEEPDISSDDFIEAEDDAFKKTMPLTSSCSRPTSIPLPQDNVYKPSSAHERLFGRSTDKTGRAADLPVGSENRSPTKRWKRRHYTVSGYQCMFDPQFSPSSQDRPRSRDDVDMERCLRTANTPDIVRSTIKKKEVFDEKMIDRELGLPQKIVIPERYIEDEPEQLSASERLRRSLKAENIRKMLSETATIEDISEGSGAQPEKIHKKLNEEKRKRAHLLALNHALAREVMERSKVVAANVYGTENQASS